MADKPDYRIIASRDSETSGLLVEIGVAWIRKDKNGRNYISAVLNARPWGAWNGEVQLHRIEGMSE